MQPCKAKTGVCHLLKRDRFEKGKADSVRNYVVRENLMSSMKDKERRGTGSGKPLWTRFFVFVPVWQKSDSTGKTRDRHPEARTEKTRDRHPEALRLLELYAFLKEMKHADHYIAGSDYRDRIREFSDTLTFFRNLESAGAFAEFCRREGWSSLRGKSREDRQKTQRAVPHGKTGGGKRIPRPYPGSGRSGDRP